MPTTTHLRRFVAAGLAAGMLLAGCSSDDHGSDAMVDGSFGLGGVAATDQAERSPNPEMAMGSDADQPGSQEGRSLARVGHLELVFDDPEGKIEAVLDEAEAAGGYLANSQLSREGDGIAVGWLDLRIPEPQLDPVMDTLDGLADRVPARETQAEDVGAQLTDLDARLGNLERYERELQDLLGDVREAGEGADDLLVVFDRLNRVREDIERLAAQQSSLEDRVAHARLRVDVRASVRASGGEGDSWSFGDTLHAAWNDTIDLATRLIDVGVSLIVTWLPVGLLTVGPLAAIGVLTRRRWRKRPDRTGPDPAAPGETDG